MTVISSNIMMTRRGESCHAMMALTVIHSLNQTVIKYQRLMKHETLSLSHHYPRWLVNKFTLFIFSQVVTPHTGQDPGQAGAWGYPRCVIREIFWFIILARVSTLPGLPCPPLVPGTEAWTIRTQLDWQSIWKSLKLKLKIGYWLVFPFLVLTFKNLGLGH